MKDNLDYIEDNEHDATVDAVIRCPECGRSNPSNETYCVECGMLLDDIDEDEASDSTLVTRRYNEDLDMYVEEVEEEEDDELYEEESEDDGYEDYEDDEELY